MARSCVCRPGSASPEGDLEHGGADAVLVANAHLRVAEPIDREVLTELAEDEIVALQLVAPVAVRVELIDVDGALRLRARRDHLGRPRSTFFRRTCRGPCTAFFQIPVKTVRPCQLTSRGIPTLTDTSLASRPDIRTQHLSRLSGTPGTLQRRSSPGSWKRLQVQRLMRCDYRQPCG